MFVFIDIVVIIIKHTDVKARLVRELEDMENNEPKQGQSPSGLTSVAASPEQKIS